jgi:DNA polymerase-3 subunit delta
VSKAKQVDWRKVEPGPVVLAFGPEDYLVSRVVRSVREQLRLIDSSLEVTELDAAEYIGGQLADITGPSLFAATRFVIIRGVERCSDELISDGIDYLQNLNPEATLLLVHSGASVRGKKLLDALRADANVSEVACAKITKDAEKSAFITAEFASESRQISPGAVRALQDAFSEDLAELASACQQLMQDSSSVITEELVDSYYGGRVEVSNFKVVDAALAGQAAKALALLRHALASGSDPVQLVSAAALLIRRLAKSFGNRSITAGDLGVAPWQLEQVRRSLPGWTEEGIARAVNALVDADAAAKGGHRDPVYVIEQLVLLVAKRGMA